MKGGPKNIANRYELQWVVLLLGLAVVLPTVCLLWFMSEVVKSERLVVRQKVRQVYQGNLESLAREIDISVASRLSVIDTLGRANPEPIESFRIMTDQSGDKKSSCCSVLIYDKRGSLLYPILQKDQPGDPKLPDSFNRAWNAEYTQQDFTMAAEYYARIAEQYGDKYEGLLAQMGQVRCLRKAGDIEAAIEICNRLGYIQLLRGLDYRSIQLAIQARLLLIEMKQDFADGLEIADIEQLVDSAISYTSKDDQWFLPMTSDTRVFYLEKAIEIASQSDWSQALLAKLSHAERLLKAEQLALEAAETFGSTKAIEPLVREGAAELISSLGRLVDAVEQGQWAERLNVDTSVVKELVTAAESVSSNIEIIGTASTLQSWPSDEIRRLPLPGQVYGLYHKTAEYDYLILDKAELSGLKFLLFDEQFASQNAGYRVTDSQGQYVSGIHEPAEEKLAETAMGTYFPGWRISLYATEDDVFTTAANKQIAIYWWTGTLVIVLIFASGALSAKAITRQAKINRMKNDFIATVTHELKTPLASMRVLIDTLIEGNVRNEEQVTEYLRLTSKENERLSRMIDNFLTFSRMERNKKTFTIVSTPAAVIAQDATEAVAGKFSVGNCEFDVDIAADLPDVLADHDAMVTVLVNLLDNAYKYSFDDKEIKLRVYRQDNKVCFEVSDKGVGMGKRAVRKVFDRFYQVDRSLARRAEGCGLGLSIVKFILDAHKVNIEVQSKVGQGSMFKITLPVAER